MRHWWFLALLGAGTLQAETTPNPRAQRSAELNVGESIAIPRLRDDDITIKIDGKLDESVWERAAVITDFTVIDPDTMAPPRWALLRSPLMAATCCVSNIAGPARGPGADALGRANLGDLPWT